MGGICAECDHMRRVALGLADDDPLPDRCRHGRALVHCWRCQSDHDREVRDAIRRGPQPPSEDEGPAASWLEMFRSAWGLRDVWGSE